MYPPANQCVYCGATDVPLSKEHIVPYSLGGSLILPRASCRVHAELTSALEREVARDTYGFHRAHEGTQSRRKGRHSAVLQQLVGVAGLDLKGNPVQAQVAASELPRLQMIVRPQPPGVLRGGRDDITDP